jgi:hypothetical protein
MSDSIPILQFWWVLPLCAALFMYKFVLRVFFGMIIVPDDRIGLVVKKFALSGDKRLPDGRIIAINGEAGMQAKAPCSGLVLAHVAMAIHHYHGSVYHYPAK